MSYKRIKELREKNFLSQDQLAEKLGVTLKTIQNWEQGDVSQPLPDLRSKIASLYFSGDMGALYDYFKDTDVGNENLAWDFSAENAILTHSIKDGSLMPIYEEPLRILFDKENSAAAGKALSCILGALRFNPIDCLSVLGEISALMQTSTTLRMGAELETISHDLLMRLEYISSTSSELSDNFRSEINAAVTHLKCSRLSNDISDRLMAHRHCFFVLSDNYKFLKDMPNYYYALSDLIIPLEGSLYDAPARKHLFYALLDIAKQLSHY